MPVAAAATTTPASPADGPAATGRMVVDPPPPTRTGPVEPGQNGEAPQPGGNSTPETGDGGLPDVAAQPGWKVGESRPYELFVHCGIKDAKIGAEWWVVQGTPATPTMQAHRGKPSDPNRPIDPNNLHGTMTLVEPFLARFTWDAGDGKTGSADFAPPVPATRMELCQ